MNDEDMLKLVSNCGDDQFKQTMLKMRGKESKEAEKISLSQRVINLKREMKQKIELQRHEELIKLKEITEQKEQQEAVDGPQH